MSKKTAPLVPYTIPKICNTDSRDWYIWFRYYHAGKWTKRPYREDINRIKDPKLKEDAAEALRQAKEDWLKLGWNPIVDPEFKARNIVKVSDLKSMLFCEAMDFALGKKKLAKKTKQDYGNQLVYVKAMAEKLGYSALPVSQFKRVHFMHLLHELSEERKFSNHNYNKYRDTVRAMFTVLLKWEAVEYNPASMVDDLKTAESNLYASLTQEEKNKISKLLCTQYYNFYRFILVIYHTGIRPKEILALRIRDIDLKKQLITIVPDIEEENSKTTNLRYVPIPDELLPYLEELELHKYPKDYYVFGSPFESGKGNRGAGSRAWSTVGMSGRFTKTGISGAKRPDYLMPSPNHVKRDSVTKLWKELVIDDAGIDKKMYALKHTGGDDKILAGIDLDALREMYGHTSKYMTENYAKIIKEVNATQIRKKAPAFAAPVMPMNRKAI
jgi:integrase